MKINANLTSALSEVSSRNLRASEQASTGKPLELALDAIQADPNQPRRAFDKAALNELADSIKEQGVIQPIIVCMVDGGHQIIAGERRWRAAKLAGLTTVPVFVRASMDDYAQVIENEQRENLTALELATFIQKRLDAGESQTIIAKKLGKPKSVISEHHALNKAPEAVRTAMDSGKIQSARTGKDLIGLYETHDAKALDRHISGMETIGRNDVPLIAESVPSSSRRTADKTGLAKSGKGKSSSRRTAGKAGSKITKPVTAADVKNIQQLRPIISVWIKRKHGRLAYNIKTSNDSYAWVLFDKQTNVIEQVKYTDLELRHVETQTPIEA